MRPATAVPTSPDTDRKNVVQSLSKGLRVLEAVARADDAMTLSEVARLCGYDVATCFRMLNTLVEDGYVRRLEGRRFAVTLKVLDLGHRAIAKRDVRETVRPILRALVGETREAASFAVLEGEDVLYVERVRAGFVRLGVDIQVGTTVPAHRSVIGRTMLAFLPVASGHAPPPQGEGDLADILRSIRRDGFYAADSLLQNGLFVVAAPVLGRDGVLIGGISVAVPAVRVGPEGFTETILDTLLAATRDLGVALSAGGTVLGL